MSKWFTDHRQSTKIQNINTIRTLGKCDEALECLKGAKEQFFLAAPSYDTASLLYEEVRLKIYLVKSKRMVINFSDVRNDYNRIVKHLDYLEDNRSHLSGCLPSSLNA